MSKHRYLNLGLDFTRILSKVWDPETDDKYEQQLEEPNKMPSQRFSSFVDKRFKCLETTKASKQYHYVNNKERRDIITTFSRTNRNTILLFSHCRTHEHNIYQCSTFKLQER